jgi:hypothetical protein
MYSLVFWREKCASASHSMFLRVVTCAMLTSDTLISPCFPPSHRTQSTAVLPSPRCNELWRTKSRTWRTEIPIGTYPAGSQRMRSTSARLVSTSSAKCLTYKARSRRSELNLQSLASPRPSRPATRLCGSRSAGSGCGRTSLVFTRSGMSPCSFTIPW